MSAPLDAPKPGNILFIVPCPSAAQDLEGRPASFELEIPLDDLKQLVLRPVRWLKLLAWGLLSCTGRVLDTNNVSLHEDALYDELPAGAYTFLPDEDAHIDMKNLEHVCTYPTGLDDTASSPRESADAILEERDGGACVFSGCTPGDDARILPQRYARNAPGLHALAVVRGVAVKHYTDAQNRLTIGPSINQTWHEHQCFILATDPQFLRDEDIPQPLGPPLGFTNWAARPAPAGETYILQSLERVLHPNHAIRRLVRSNERARFAGDGARPCARAVNFTYAVGMVVLYRRPCADGERIPSRPLAVVPPARMKRPTLSETAPDEFSEMTPGAALRQVEQLQREEDEARMRQVQDW